MASSTYTHEDPGQPRADGKPVLVVVGHWDDELISAWGVMCRHRPDVLCLTDKPMPGYREIFEELVVRLGGRPLNWDIPLCRPDGRFADLDAPGHVRRMAKLLDAGQYTRVYAHHFDGDVGGHRQHVMIARLCYLAIAAAGRKKTTQLMCFRSKPGARAIDGWFRGEGPEEVITLSQAENDLRLQYARRYKSDFEKRYPSILSPVERHAPIPVRGGLWRLILTARHAWPRAGVRFVRSLLRRRGNRT